MPRVGSTKDNPKGKRRVGTPKARDPIMNDTVRAEIVTRLAMYDTVAEIQRSLAERGIEVTSQAISHYNPANSQPPAQKWIDLFFQTREAWTQEMMAEPIAHRAYRLRKLDKLYHMAEKKGAIPLAAAILEQAAKEMGNVFSNVTKVKGQVDHQVTEVSMTADEMRNMLADRLKEAVMKQAKPVASKQLSDQSAKG